MPVAKSKKLPEGYSVGDVVAVFWKDAYSGPDLGDFAPCCSFGVLLAVTDSSFKLHTEFATEPRDDFWGVIPRSLIGGVFRIMKADVFKEKMEKARKAGTMPEWTRFAMYLG